MFIHDHSIIRSGVVELSKHVRDIKLIATAGHWEEAVGFLSYPLPDVLVLGSSIDQARDVTVTKQILAYNPLFKVLLYTDYIDCKHVRHILTLGALGFLLKSSEFSEFVQAVKTVAQGDTYLSHEITARLMHCLDHEGNSDRHGSILTMREREVLRLVARGMTNKEIADQLIISPRTVDSHRRNIMDKLDLHNAAALSYYAAKHGLAD